MLRSDVIVEKEFDTSTPGTGLLKRSLLSILVCLYTPQATVDEVLRLVNLMVSIRMLSAASLCAARSVS